MKPEIVGIDVDWMERFANDPDLVLVLDSDLPPYKDHVWSTKNGVYFAEHPSGYCSYLYKNNPKTKEQGFGGAAFTLRMESGETITLHGPWSGSGSVVNAQGFGPVVDVSIREPGHGCAIGAAWLVEKLQPVVARLRPDLELYERNVKGREFWVVKERGKPPKNPDVADQGSRNPELSSEQANAVDW